MVLGGGGQVAVTFTPCHATLSLLPAVGFSVSSGSGSSSSSALVVTGSGDWDGEEKEAGCSHSASNSGWSFREVSR